jgi:hypothetical protein
MYLVRKDSIRMRVLYYDAVIHPNFSMLRPVKSIEWYGSPTPTVTNSSIMAWNIFKGCLEVRGEAVQLMKETVRIGQRD